MVFREPDCLAIRICMAAMPVDRRNMPGCRLRMLGRLVIPEGMTDEQVLFLSDIFPTGYMAAENCNIKPGHIVAVWGCGPVGQFAIRSAFLLGAEKVIAIDNVPERMRMAEQGGAILVSSDEDVHDILLDMTGGRGPDACIDAVGMEAHGSSYDVVKTIHLETDRPYVLRQAMRVCRKGGTLSIPGSICGILWIRFRWVRHLPKD